MSRLGAPFLAFALFLAAAFGEQANGSDATIKVTIEVADALLDQGGLVLVVGRPISEDRWREIVKAIGGGPGQPTAQIRVGSPASAVEVFYPETGTYAFSLRSFDARDLRTRELSVGSGSVLDPETRQAIEWPSQSAIYVAGSRHDERWARIAADAFPQAFRDGAADDVSVDHYVAGRVLTLSDEALGKFVEIGF